MHKKTDLGNNLFFLDFGDGWSALERVDNGDYIDLHTTELANIPQVKALIEALKEAEWAGSTLDKARAWVAICPWCWVEKGQEHEKDCTLKLALDAFKCLPDDKETK